MTFNLSQFGSGGSPADGFIDVEVLMVGGGGGAGGMYNATFEPGLSYRNNPTAFGGGGGGAAFQGYIPVKQGISNSISIGAGGAVGSSGDSFLGFSGPSTPGSNGGQTTFTFPAGTIRVAGGGGGASNSENVFYNPYYYDINTGNIGGTGGGCGGPASFELLIYSAGSYLRARDSYEVARSLYTFGSYKGNSKVSASDGTKELNSFYDNGYKEYYYDLKTPVYSSTISTKYGTLSGYPSAIYSRNYPVAYTAPYSYFLESWNYNTPFINTYGGGAGGDGDSGEQSALFSDITGITTSYGKGGYVGIIGIKGSQFSPYVPSIGNGLPVPPSTSGAPTYPYGGQYTPPITPHPDNTGYGGYGWIDGSISGSPGYYSALWRNCGGASGVVVVRYNNAYPAATFGTPGGYEDVSPNTPGFNTYKITAPGTFTIPN